jgi:hypothetical protein
VAEAGLNEISSNDILLLKSIESWYRNLERTTRDAAKIVITARTPDAEGSKTDSEG